MTKNTGKVESTDDYRASALEGRLPVHPFEPPTP